MNDYNRGALKEPCLRLPYGWGKEVASIELGDSTGYVRLSDYEWLKAENRRLKESASDYMQANERLHIKLKQYKHIVQVQHPRAVVELIEKHCKLCELMRDMMRFFEDDDACEHCGHDAECEKQNGLTIAYEEDCLMRDVFKERMRELGIEEDDE